MRIKICCIATVEEARLAIAHAAPQPVATFLLTCETAAASFVDARLLDGGDPNAAVKELGGTGQVHDWAISRRIVETACVPVFLAGGLRAGNVAAAIRAERRRVRPRRAPDSPARRRSRSRSAAR